MDLSWWSDAAGDAWIQQQIDNQEGVNKTCTSKS
jgi:hypothetical protein